VITTKKRRADEEKDLALVGLKRMVERNRADKMHQSLHLIDMPKSNSHIRFIDSL